MKQSPRISPAASAPTLSEIQDSLQAAILSGDDAILASLMDNSHTTRDILFGVYRHAYASRLADVLMNEYPLLRAYVGDKDFSALARAYIGAHPSRNQNARWFGTGFPAFLAKQDAAVRSPVLPDLACIERDVSNAFDALDARVLGFADLAKFPPEDWGRLVFAPQPSAAMLRTGTNAFAIWKSLKDGGTPGPAVRLASPEHLIVWRQGVTPRVRVMPYEEAMMWAEASRGVRFDALCELLAAFDDPDSAAVRAAGYLQGWLTAELLTAAAMTDGAASAAKAIQERL